MKTHRDERERRRTNALRRGRFAGAAGFALILGLLVGCQQPAESPAESAAEAPAETEATAETSGIADPDIISPDDAGDVWASEARQELLDLEAEIEAVTAQAEQLDEGARAAMLQSAQALDEQIDDARARMDELGEETEENLEASRDLVDAQIDDIREQVVELSNELDDGEDESGE